MKNHSVMKNHFFVATKTSERVIFGVDGTGSRLKQLNWFNICTDILVQTFQEFEHFIKCSAAAIVQVLAQIFVLLYWSNKI